MIGARIALSGFGVLLATAAATFMYGALHGNVEVGNVTERFFIGGMGLGFGLFVLGCLIFVVRDEQ